jgi:hypothetical protein
MSIEFMVFIGVLVAAPTALAILIVVQQGKHHKGHKGHEGFQR